MKIILSILLTFIFAFSAFGQKTVEQIQAQLNTFKDGKKYSVKYDPFKDKSFVQTATFNLVSGGESLAAGIADGLDRRSRTSEGITITKAFNITAGFYFDGQTLTSSPTHMFITITTASNNWMFLNDNRLYIVYDGERVELKAVENSNLVGNRGSVAEKLLYTIPIEKLEKIANSKTVQIFAGGYQKPLKKEFVEMLKNIVTVSRSI